MASDPVDSYANVQLGDGRHASMLYAWIEKIDRKRLSHEQWQGLLSGIVHGELQDITNAYDKGRYDHLR